jgi:hypothetical protein
MQRRSALGHLAVAVAGISLGEVPELDPRAPLPADPFSISDHELAESAGLLSCPGCGEVSDSLELTPAGVCLRCAARRPRLKAEPYSDPFWTLSPREVRRAEAELRRLSLKLERMNQRLVELRERQLADGSDVYDRAMESGRAQWLGLQRELHLLHLLRAASRQFAA